MKKYLQRPIFLLILASTLLVSCANNNNTINEKMDTTNMVNVIASIEVKEGKLDEFLKIFNANVPNVLAENGCIEYMPTTDIITDLAPQVKNENIVTIIEKWESLEALQAHLIAPHMKEYKKQSKDLVSNVTLKVLKDASK